VQRYQTKVQLAAELVRVVVSAGLKVAYVVGDTHYTAGWFTKRLARLGLTWHGTLDPKTIVVWRSQRQAVRELAQQLHLKWREHLGLRAKALRVYAPKYGQLRLVVTRNRHGNYEYLVSNDLKCDLTTMVLRKRSRWSVETVFRDTKQFAGLEACQCWVDQALVRHIGLVFLTFVVLQLLRLTPTESVGAVKERWQLAVIRDGEQPPAPLRACPPDLRPTAYVLSMIV
jgi:SRSO17 transposase